MRTWRRRTRISWQRQPVSPFHLCSTAAFGQPLLQEACRIQGRREVGGAEVGKVAGTMASRSWARGANERADTSARPSRWPLPPPPPFLRHRGSAGDPRVHSVRFLAHVAYKYTLSCPTSTGLVHHNPGLVPMPESQLPENHIPFQLYVVYMVERECKPLAAPRDGIQKKNVKQKTTPPPPV